MNRQILLTFLVGLIVLQVLDLLSTAAFLERGGVEANPLSAWMLAEYGFWSLIVGKVVAVTAAVGLYWLGQSYTERRLPEALPKVQFTYGLAGLLVAWEYVWVVYHNTGVLA